MKPEKVDVPEEVSSQANAVADLVDPGGEVGEVIPEVKTSCLYCGYRLLFIISVFFSHVSHLSYVSFEVEDMAAIGAMETGVMVRETLVVVIGALVAVADTEVEEDTPLATEKIGKHLQ